MFAMIGFTSAGPHPSKWQFLLSSLTNTFLISEISLSNQVEGLLYWWFSRFLCYKNLYPSAIVKQIGLKH
jgi:hypothetical protein